MVKKVTESLERAMFLNHGITYADYEANLENLIRVEIDREGDHRKASEMAAAFSSRKSG